MRSKKLITCSLIFLPLYHSSFKNFFLPVDCIVAGLSSLMVVFLLLVYRYCGWYGVPNFRCRPRVCVFSPQHDDTRRSVISDREKNFRTFLIFATGRRKRLKDQILIDQASIQRISLSSLRRVTHHQGLAIKN